MSKESNNIVSLSGLEVNKKKGTRKETQRIRETVFRNASKEALANLIPEDKKVLDLLFPSEGQGATLTKAGESLDVTGETIRLRRNKAIEYIKKFERGETESIKKRRKSRKSRKRTNKLRLEMTPEIREILLERKGWPVARLSALIGRSPAVVTRWNDELGIPRGPTGCPPREHRNSS